jgi:hypothetical protein
MSKHMYRSSIARLAREFLGIVVSLLYSMENTIVWEFCV